MRRKLYLLEIYHGPGRKPDSYEIRDFHSFLYFICSERSTGKHIERDKGGARTTAFELEGRRRLGICVREKIRFSVFIILSGLA